MVVSEFIGVLGLIIEKTGDREIMICGDGFNLLSIGSIVATQEVLVVHHSKSQSSYERSIELFTDDSGDDRA